MIEVYLLETIAAEEWIILHVPNTDLWFIDIGPDDNEDIQQSYFTNLFWDNLGATHILTKIGNL